MNEPLDREPKSDPLRFATLCLIMGFIAGLGLGVAAAAAEPTSGSTIPERR